MSFFTLASVILGAAVIYMIRAVWSRKKTPGPLPPGPVGKPIVGNISDLPPPGVQDWAHWLKHKELYGMALMRYNTRILYRFNRIHTCDLLRAYQLCHSVRTNHRHHQ